ncbi:MAG: hypothetical protein WBL28_07525 [Methylotenera sp.]
MMKNNPVVWFEIYVQDMARAKAFYESVFQTKLEMMSEGEIEMWAFPGAKIANLALPVRWLRCKECLQAATAQWYILVVRIVQ